MESRDNTVYWVNIANLIDILIELDAKGVEYINMRFYSEQNKVSITPIGRSSPLPDNFTIDDLIN